MPPRNLKHCVPVEELKEVRIDVPESPKHYSLIQTSFSLPPYIPKLRVNVMGVKRKHSRYWPHETLYILSSKEGATLVVATLRKAADMIESYIERLPNKEL